MKREFQVHMLTEIGKVRARSIAEGFNHLLVGLEHICPDRREFAICKTKLEEACFFAKKSLTDDPENVESVL